MAELTLVAQLQMGDSWRIGVDPAARSDPGAGGGLGGVDLHAAHGRGDGSDIPTVGSFVPRVGLDPLWR